MTKPNDWTHIRLRIASRDALMDLREKLNLHRVGGCAKFSTSDVVEFLIANLPELESGVVRDFVPTEKKQRGRPWLSR